MQWFPIFLQLRGQPVLIVGGGKVATRKVDLLRKAQAEITVLAPALTDEIAQLAQVGAIRHVAEPFAQHWLNGPQLQPVLVVAATNDMALNAQVSTACKAMRIPVNVVDNPALCSFVTPSIVDRSPVTIAISSGGSAPVLARMLRARLESMIPAAYGRLAQMAAAQRAHVKAALPDVLQRRRFWEHVFDGPIAEHVFSGRERAADRALQQAVASLGDELAPARGEVYLVGGGPGDPDLLTLRALRLMQQADVVLHDQLVSDEVLALVRRDAERINVGKRASQHTRPQQDINQLLIELAQQGKRVLRLKGGDPFVFGRGGEEIGDLAQAGIPFQVVPGITAANGCGAYAGIPMTHRDYADSVCFVTAHLQADGGVRLDWARLVAPRQTLVVYMGLKALPVVTAQLQQAGMAADTPVAVVEDGTTHRQRMWLGNLQDIHSQVAEADIHGPALTIIGDVVRLHERLDWFHADTAI